MQPAAHADSFNPRPCARGDTNNPHVDPIEVRMRIGMVFQKPNPFPKSIFENVAYGLEVRGVGREKIKQRVPPLDQLRVFDCFKILPQMQALADRWNQEVAF